MNPRMIIGMLVYGGILAAAGNIILDSRDAFQDDPTPRYSTNPSVKRFNNPEGERIITEYAMLPDGKRNKVKEICINYYVARYQRFALEDNKAIIELYTKFGSFDAIIEHFQPSNKH
jgi:hypothetical protein